jgi:gamma-glutamyltranspeptidase
VVTALEAKGHAVRLLSGHARAIFGKGAIITRRVDGSTQVLCGGADGRGDGAVAAW